MSSDVMHQEASPITSSQHGSVGGVDKVHDFGSRKVDFATLDMNVLSAFGTEGQESYFVTAQFALDDAGNPGNPDPASWRNVWKRDILPGSVESWSTVFSNRVWVGWDPSGYRRFFRVLLTVESFALAQPQSLEIIVTLSEGDDLVVQAAPVPTPGANVYASIPGLLALMATWSCIPATFFPLLPPGRQEAIWIGATRRIETEVRSLCPPQPSGSAPVNPDTQRLVWPRRGAHGLDGLLITSWLSSWVEGIAHYAEEMARAEIDGVAVDEPGETQGMTSIQLGPEDADFRGQWGSDGKSGSFFAAPGRAKIWNLLSESFQSRSRG